MNLNHIAASWDDQQVVNGMDLCKEVAAATGIDPMRAFFLVGTAAQQVGAEVLVVGAKGDQSAYLLEDAEQIATYALVTA